MEHQRGREWQRSWPRARDGLTAGATYDGRTGTIVAARGFVAEFLARAQAEQGVAVTGRLLEDARLVISELVTNAAKYAPGPCLLDLELLDPDLGCLEPGVPDLGCLDPGDPEPGALDLGGGVLRITLWDTQPALPVPSEPDPARIGRHGLEIVLALCRRFEVERQAGGKRVQVDLEL
ncbi:ATP-binding protein [Streptacidiphilus carbonis]|jgi:hypothetical protein|uniref:ATP-binding protein n=1 Tax=Streptacidiphilus carbonis TaxID=105422 RepID=UPI0005A88717|nr:ATP-binding protein [Streptacidiphilus carbonis]